MRVARSRCDMSSPRWGQTAAWCGSRSSGAGDQDGVAQDLGLFTKAVVARHAWGATLVAGGLKRWKHRLTRPEPTDRQPTSPTIGGVHALALFGELGSASRQHSVADQALLEDEVVAREALDDGEPGWLLWQRRCLTATFVAGAAEPRASSNYS